MSKIDINDLDEFFNEDDYKYNKKLKKQKIRKENIKRKRKQKYNKKYN